MFLWSIKLLRGATIPKCIDRFGVGGHGQPELSSFFGVSRKSKMFVAKKYLISQIAEGGAGVICYFGNVIINGAIII